jgi:hypothetical protein
MKRIKAFVLPPAVMLSSLNLTNTNLARPVFQSGCFLSCPRAPRERLRISENQRTTTSCWQKSPLRPHPDTSLYRASLSIDEGASE